MNYNSKFIDLTQKPGDSFTKEQLKNNRKTNLQTIKTETGYQIKSQYWTGHPKKVGFIFSLDQLQGLWPETSIEFHRNGILKECFVATANEQIQGFPIDHKSKVHFHPSGRLRLVPLAQGKEIFGKIIEQHMYLELDENSNPIVVHTLIHDGVYQGQHFGEYFPAWSGELVSEKSGVN